MQINNKRMVASAILIFALAVANIVNYFEDEVVLVKAKTVYIEQNIKDSVEDIDIIEDTYIVDKSNKQIVKNINHIVMDKEKLQPYIEESNDYYEDIYAQPKLFNQNLNFVKSVNIVNSTSEYEKDLLRQLFEYEEDSKR